MIAAEISTALIRFFFGASSFWHSICNPLQAA